ncbi:hypothetical protein SEA_SLOOPYJOE_35 [Arthrobacter phage Sloopyjoe]|nr:hypothetical protein PBI_STAYER_35 [Arthrobacter phage Stayer]QFG09744.1 hypothetical protein PBI_SHIBA_35 [Arthrobacter phage Shiba]QFG10179.1 hypothetical protein PBI_EGAD_35 [Arthrobacter phage Egad]QFG11749.1 hypothetical protein PBI_SALK_35 [Arthrobacter phage Salk]QFG12632.1 hypothetical protein PBI_MICHELLE_35 [Arthrobacter phage Michelle]QFG14405.1 hypothetical protein PBI_STARLORD_35 [Arthrobacter phage StarLord]UVT31113.1 hypothetical protein PBI_LINDA_35 [Arthrobacter phage Lind
MNREQKIVLIVATTSAASAALISSAIYSERMAKLKNQVRSEQFVSEVMTKAFIRSTKNMSGKEFSEVLFTAIDDTKFERIVSNLKK